MLEIEELLKYAPADWTAATYAQDYELVEIPSYSSTYLTLNNQIQGSFNLGTTKIVRVQNPFLYSQFLMRKEEYVHRGLNPRVQTLFHDTAESKIPSIVTYNLDWRRANRVKYGQGVSFSPSPQYANRQSSRSNGTDRAIIFTDVLVANCETVSDSKNIPDAGYDTTMGNCGNVYVKYYDDEFYPKYVAYYKSNVIDIRYSRRRRGFFF